MSAETFLPTDPKVKSALVAADQWIKILVKEIMLIRLTHTPTRAR